MTFHSSQTSNTTTSSDFGGEVVGAALFSVLVATIGVSLQIGAEKTLQVVGGLFVATAFGAAIPVLFAAIGQGMINAVLAHFFFGQRGLGEATEARIRGFVVATLTGAVIGVGIGGLFQGATAGGGGSGGSGSSDLFPAALAFAFIMVCAGIVGAVVSVLLNRALMMLGLRVAAELTQDLSGQLAWRLAPEFLVDRWRGHYDAENDRTIALVKGLGTGTKWLATCDGHDSNAVVRGVLAGMLSGTAVFHLEAVQHGATYGFWWEVFVELLAALAAVVGSGVIIGLIVAIFRYPLSLLTDIIQLAVIVGVILMLIRACSG